MGVMVQVITYRPEFKEAFIRLNTEWIERYFKFEKSDIIQMQSTEESILKPGGEIFFVMYDQQVVGTCAMIPHGHKSFELAKMAVLPELRGKGFGDLLIESAIAWAIDKKAEEVILLSNTILEPAIRLYKKHGFETTHLGPHPDYERCNIVMRLDLTALMGEQ